MASNQTSYNHTPLPEIKNLSLNGLFLAPFKHDQIKIFSKIKTKWPQIKPLTCMPQSHKSQTKPTLPLIGPLSGTPHSQKPEIHTKCEVPS